MSEEKIRNYKSGNPQVNTSESIPSFLLKTYQILENSKYSDIICWTKNGEGFVVKKVKEFAENILPTHFRHSNYTSFVRQLNMYDFHKTRQENQENAFKNSMFKRGQRHLLKEIERKDYKKKKERPENTEQEGAMQHENQSGNDKIIEFEKQFYLKSLEAMRKIDEDMTQRQQELAQINSVDQSSQGICKILDFILGVKNLNNSLELRMNQIGKQWDTMIFTKKKNLRQQIESENLAEKPKPADPTMNSLNSLKSM